MTFGTQWIGRKPIVIPQACCKILTLEKKKANNHRPVQHCMFGLTCPALSCPCLYHYVLLHYTPMGNITWIQLTDIYHKVCMKLQILNLLLLVQTGHLLSIKNTKTGHFSLIFYFYKHLITYSDIMKNVIGKNNLRRDFCATYHLFLSTQSLKAPL